MKKDYNNFYILNTVGADASVSQRTLSSQMKLNVASVNFAIKNMVQKGLITMLGVNPRRTKYYITPEGLREKTRLAYKFFARNMHFYTEVRSDIESRIVDAFNGIETSIAIYGACELSEIAYMVVSKMGCNFLGFFLDDSKITNDKILDYNVQNLSQLKGNHQYLLLLTDEFSKDAMCDMDTRYVKTLNLADRYNLSEKF